MCAREAVETGVTRREAIRILGLGASVGAFAHAFPGTLAAHTGEIIRTILEDISPARLTGMTLFHEHLSMSRRDGGPLFYDDMALMTDEVKACAADGVGCIVDAGVAGLGRKIPALRTIARQSGMFVVAGGGLHARDEYPADVLSKGAEQVADDFVELAQRERWGIIGEMGTGTSVPMDPQERKGLQAAARAHLRTGLSIITHTSDGCVRCALDQVDLFEAAGANLSRVVIGHLNDIRQDLTPTTIAIAKRGANVGLDHSGKPNDSRADEFVRTVLALLDAGHEDRVFLSSDFASSSSLRKQGGPGIDMTVTNFLPQLRRAGVSDATIHKIMVENPKRLLTFVPKGV